jgi:hypothetical protein
MSAADDLRAMCLQAMREHAAIKPRGYDSIRARESLHRQIDELLDDWALERLVDDTETATATGEQNP